MHSYIPYGAYWSTPYARWQGALAHLHSFGFAAHVAKAELAKRGIAPSAFDYGVLGNTVPQTNSFYGLPWITAMMGAPHVGGPTINQACATSARILSIADQEIRDGHASCALVLATDRTSNGPHLYYPDPDAPGGQGVHENWVTDNFKYDPYAHVSMVQTAENVAAKYQIGTSRQHEIVLRRYEQYEEARADDSAFHRRFMSLPFHVPDAKYRKTRVELAGDEGLFPTTAEGLAKLKPQVEGGTVTFGGQTHPADGNTAIVVTTQEKARELSHKPEIEVRIAGFGQARTEPAHMPFAPVPASKRALEHAELSINDIAVVKSHNPFIVNDLVFAHETGFDVMKMNNYGCSLVWGHPQGPTGLRAIVEMIEELEMRGGGYGLFQGCAAGDSAMAVIVEVTGAKRG
jgi:acetyl-CoA acetyltransferase family protein